MSPEDTVHYLGGKARVGPKISSYLESVRQSRRFVEPFCGGLWITYLMSGKRIASDSNLPLITLYRNLQRGWVPPSVVTEEIYHHYKSHQDPTDPMVAFVGIGCSFSGKWFGGYARSKDRNYALNAKNSLLRKMARCGDVEFIHWEYEVAVEAAEPNSLIYFDPPYRGTTGYTGGGAFDSGIFWEVVRLAAVRGHPVFVSEYVAPPDFKCVLEMPTKTDLRVNGIKEARTERLFTCG